MSNSQGANWTGMDKIKDCEAWIFACRKPVRN